MSLSRVNKQLAPKLNNVSNLLNVKTAARLATVSKNFKNEYERRLKGINERKKVVTAQAAQEGERRKKEAIKRIYNHLNNIPGYTKNIQNMIDVYRHMSGHRVNVIRLLEIRRDHQALMRKLQKHQKRMNNAYNKYIANSLDYKYNTSGWN